MAWRPAKAKSLKSASGFGPWFGTKVAPNNIVSNGPREAAGKAQRRKTEARSGNDESQWIRRVPLDAASPTGGGKTSWMRRVPMDATSPTRCGESHEEEGIPGRQEDSVYTIRVIWGLGTTFP